MSFGKFDLSLPDDFANLVRLFPLPNVVLYPGVLQGLHIFEPRYLRLLSDSLTSDSLITMAAIKSDSVQTLLAENPTIYPTVCIGRIVTQSRLEDGRYNILLAGVSRAKIVRELDSDLPYRMANVRILQDRCEGSEDEVAEIRQELISKFGLYARNAHLDTEPVKHILSNRLPFGLVTDLISYAIAGPASEQVKVLEAVENMARARLVLEVLSQKLAQLGKDDGPSRFPPGFSLN